MIKAINKYVDIVHYLKFFLFFIPLYTFQVFYLGIVTPGGGLYSPFLERFLNFFGWITNSILYVSNLIVQFFGLPSYVKVFHTINGFLYQLKIKDGATVTVYGPCIGLGIVSFWIAYVLFHKLSWKKKLVWCAIGSFAIWFINCWRIAILLYASENKWPANPFMDHHFMFNCVAYAIIILLIYLFNQWYSKEQDANQEL